MNKFIKIIAYLLLISSSLTVAAVDFNKLFSLQERDGITTISARKDVTLLTISKEQQITPQEEFYGYLVNYGDMQLYLTDDNSTLVMVPVAREHILSGLAIKIKLLHELNKTYFIFIDNVKEQHRSDVNKNLAFSGRASELFIKTRTLNFKKILDETQVMTGIINLLKNTMYEKQHPLTQFAPYNLSSDVLVAVPYAASEEQNETDKINCVVSNYNNSIDKDNLYDEMVAHDLSSYFCSRSKFFADYLDRQEKKRIYDEAHAGVIRKLSKIVIDNKLSTGVAVITAILIIANVKYRRALANPRKYGL